MFGLNSYDNLKQHQKMNAFHARLLNHIDGRLVYFPKLDQTFGAQNSAHQKLPTMEGGINYETQRQLLLECNRKLYAELQHLDSIKA